MNQRYDQIYVYGRRLDLRRTEILSVARDESKRDLWPALQSCTGVGKLILLQGGVRSYFDSVSLVGIG